jgi:hypothetical protein
MSEVRLSPTSSWVAVMNKDVFGAGNSTASAQQYRGWPTDSEIRCDACVAQKLLIAPGNGISTTVGTMSCVGQDVDQVGVGFVQVAFQLFGDYPPEDELLIRRDSG